MRFVDPRFLGHPHVFIENKDRERAAIKFKFVRAGSPRVTWINAFLRAEAPVAIGRIRGSSFLGGFGLGVRVEVSVSVT